MHWLSAVRHRAAAVMPLTLSNAMAKAVTRSSQVEGAAAVAGAIPRAAPCPLAPVARAPAAGLVGPPVSLPRSLALLAALPLPMAQAVKLIALLTRLLGTVSLVLGPVGRVQPQVLRLHQLLHPQV